MPEDPTSKPAPPTAPFRVTVSRSRHEATGRVTRRLNLPSGVTEWDLRRRRFHKLFHGVYVHCDTPLTEWTKAAGALLLCGDTAAASHHTAARIWGGVVPDDGYVHISTEGARNQVLGLRAHRVKVGGQDCRRVDGLLVTSPAQTFVDLGAELGLVDLVVLGDSLVKAALATPEELVMAAKAFRGAGRRLLRRAASLVRREVDSPMESRLRMLMVLAGLPEPRINHRVVRPNGSVRYRLDLSYPEFRVIVEYDGRQHAESDRQWDRDIDRREWLDTDGWRIVIVRSKDIYATPGQTLCRIVSAMRDKGMPVLRLSPEWRLHFPGRSGDGAGPV